MSEEDRAEGGGREPDGALVRLAGQAGESLVGLGWTIGVAESCTGGLLTKLLTDVPGSSRYVKGCVVAYSNESKARLLGVDEASIQEHGAVSEQVATEMARGAARVLGADVGIGVTGVAGPGGGTEEKPVGTVWFGLSVKGRTVARTRHFPGDRAEVRSAAAGFALGLLRDEVGSRG